MVLRASSILDPYQIWLEVEAGDRLARTVAGVGDGVEVGIWFCD